MKTILSFVVLLFSVSACSLFQETACYDEIEVSNEKNNSEEVYVFDEVDTVEDESTNNNSASEIKKVEQEVTETISETVPVTESTTTETVYTQPQNTSTTTYEEYKDYSKQFYIQLGAFSTLKRAEKFSTQVSRNVSFPLSVIYNGVTALYIVRSSAFATRGEAEAIKSNLKRRNVYKDAFIIAE